MLFSFSSVGCGVFLLTVTWNSRKKITLRMTQIDPTVRYSPAILNLEAALHISKHTCSVAYSAYLRLSGKGDKHFGRKKQIIKYFFIIQMRIIPHPQSIGKDQDAWRCRVNGTHGAAHRNHDTRAFIFSKITGHLPNLHPSAKGEWKCRPAWWGICCHITWRLNTESLFSIAL